MTVPAKAKDQDRPCVMGILRWLLYTPERSVENKMNHNQMVDQKLNVYLENSVLPPAHTPLHVNKMEHKDCCCGRHEMETIGVTTEPSDFRIHTAGTLGALAKLARSKRHPSRHKNYSISITAHTATSKAEPVRIPLVVDLFATRRNQPCTDARQPYTDPLSKTSSERAPHEKGARSHPPQNK